MLSLLLACVSRPSGAYVTALREIEYASRTKAPCWSRDEAPAGAAWRGCRCVEADGDWPWSDKQKEPPILQRRQRAGLIKAIQGPIVHTLERNCFARNNDK